MNSEDIIIPSQNTVPDAPSFADAAANMSKLMQQNPEQAAQIMAGLAALKNATTGGYDAYVNMCTQLDINPVDEDEWNKHDKAVLLPLIRASLKRNFPDTSVTDEQVMDIIEACAEKNKSIAAKRIMRALLMLLGAKDEQIAQWTKLGLAALAFM